jgi:hypothetical protein
MGEQAATNGVDALLIPFLQSAHAAESEIQLTELICKHADPIVSSIIRRKLRASLGLRQGSGQNQDALEIASEVRVLLLSELHYLKANPSHRTIRDFRSYVAIKTYSACADYFRQKHPNRWRLKNKLRHHLKRSNQFALWRTEDGRWLCGLKDWSGQQAASTSVDQLPQLLGSSQPTSPAALLSVVFETAGHPLELDQLVVITAEVWNIREQLVHSYDDDVAIAESLVDTKVGVDVALGERRQIERLWEEVCSLPTLQRVALLLNLRDAQGGSVIAFIPYLDIASKHEIAEMVAMPYEQFAGLWNDLPLDDLSIAQIFGITRQQVINLRKTARERLARRMKVADRVPPKSWK